jgi:hypothetical protein
MLRQLGLTCRAIVRRSIIVPSNPNPESIVNQTVFVLRRERNRQDCLNRSAGRPRWLGP